MWLARRLQRREEQVSYRFGSVSQTTVHVVHQMEMPRLDYKNTNSTNTNYKQNDHKQLDFFSFSCSVLPDAAHRKFVEVNLQACR